MATLRSVHLKVTVTMEDTYRAAIGEAMRTTGDPAVAVQRALDDLATKGVTGFVDKAGRHWSLETYVEVATRSAYSEAALDTYLGIIARAGYGLVTVSRNPTSCPKCLPWQGKVLSVDGRQAGVHEVTGPNGARRTVVVAGTLTEARAAGLLHPWCRHRLAALIPGRSARMGSTPGGGLAEKTARAERRYRSRTARAWNRRQRVALTPSAKLTAAVHARRWRGAR
jgi:hypothetical protein